MEIKQRMSKRLGWLLGVVVLVAIGVLVACGSNYNSSSDGLMLVGSQGSGLIETFSFSLGTGSIAAVSNTPQDTSSETCVLNGEPSSIVIDPAGAYAYTIVNGNSSCSTTTNNIFSLKVNSDGSTTVVGNPVGFNPENVVIQGTTTLAPPVPVVPSMMVMDPAGRFLFVADRATTTPPATPPNTPPLLYVPGAVSVFAIGSGGSVTEVAGSPFFTSTSPSTLAQSGLDIVSVAPTPTVYPPILINGVQNSVCSNPALNAPTSEYLYAVDGLGNQVFEFVVNTTSGVLTNPGNGNSMPAFGTGPTPAGVAVDPCNRFVYVSDSLSESVSAYTICNGSQTSQRVPCADLAVGGLVPVGSPVVLQGNVNGAGPIVVDPYGNYVYVLGTLSNTISPLKISPISGSLTPLSSPTVATGVGPRSIAIRADDSWMFVTNFGSTTVGGSTVSQYAVTPATGLLTQLPVIQTDNYPWGVAVK
jgi:DNA-binding beta-propeller fold protein YncE